MNQQTQSPAQVLRDLSAHDFRLLGNNHIVYMKPVTVEDKEVCGLYAANGRLLTLQDTPALATLVARHNGLEPRTVH